jgi:hypothetical protein
MQLAGQYLPAILSKLLAVALVAWLWSVVAADASAGCGDYVLLGQGHQSSSRTALAMLGHDDHPTMPEHPGGPCHGAECGQQVPSTPSVPLTIERGMDHWARLSERLPLESGVSFATRSNSSVRPLAGYPCSIEHPPNAKVC